MDPKVARRVLCFLYVAAIPATVYPAWRLAELLHAATGREAVIRLDSGVFYFLLMSIFFSFFAIERAGTVRPSSWWIKNASKIVVAHFISALLLASALATGLPVWLERQGYRECGIDDGHRVARGARMVFVLESCEITEAPPD